MDVTQPDYRAGAAAGMTALQRWYHSSTGLWQGTGWWNSANALTAVIRYTKLTGDSSHAGVIGTTFAAAQRQHAQFINDYRAFILANASSVWDYGRNAANQFGLRWAGPFDRADAARQSSALDVLIAATALSG